MAALLKVKRLTEDAILPRYAHAGDAGLDLFASQSLEIPAGQARMVPTGVSVELPENTEAQVRPRSGLAFRRQVTVLNSPGTIDAGYRGEVGVILINHGVESFTVNKGMKIAQMVVSPVISVAVEQVESLSDTERGRGGFGSTGYKAGAPGD